MRLKHHALCAAVALLFCADETLAQDIEPLKAVAEKAITHNPDVTARFNAYRASADAVDAARGGLYPRLDLNASIGREQDRITSRDPADRTLNRNGLGLTLTQLLWDGLGVLSETRQLGHERLSRYFDLLDVTEQTSLEAVRAHYDVQRFRSLVKLAEDNYVEHRSAYNLIESRVRAGVTGGVDLSQAAARVALAESNLSTELANLHDVTARYERIVGEAPPAQLPSLALLKASVPDSATEVIGTALRESPAISASIEGLRAARDGVSARQSAYEPRIEARLRGSAGKNLDAVADRKRDVAAEIVLNWNLFNGGSDQARVRQQTNLMNQAADQRDRACRDTRQTAAIAFNDTRKLTEQLVYLDRNTAAIEKARDAYRQQFEVGKRSLLDLLNAENEVYTARRAYANAEHDLAVAYARTHASMNRLGTQLGISRTDSLANEAAGWNAGDDTPTRCPVLAVDVAATPHETLDRIAKEHTPAPAATPAAAPARAAAAAAPVAPAAANPGAGAEAALQSWARSWSTKNFDAYVGHYASDFPNAKRHAKWLAQRRTRLSNPKAIDLSIEDVKSRVVGPDQVETRFTQIYKSDRFKDTTTKTLVWKRVGNDWRIIRESGR